MRLTAGVAEALHEVCPELGYPLGDEPRGSVQGGPEDEELERRNDVPSALHMLKGPLLGFHVFEIR